MQHQTRSNAVPVAKPASTAPAYRTVADIAYRDGPETADPYVSQKCRLDLYHPADKPGFATVIWFHGGGLTGGERGFPGELRDKGFAVIAVGYRLAPAVKSPVYIEDAAAATAWAYNHIADYGGDPRKIILAGHSAGAYLAAMVGLDPRWLAKYNLQADDLAGLALLSGQQITHFEIRHERGIGSTTVVVDDLAPLHFARKDGPPILLLTGDRELEMLGRYEENAYFWRMLQLASHKHVELHELRGFNHEQMIAPACPFVVRFTNDVTAQPATASQ